MNINFENFQICETRYGVMIFPNNDVVVGKSLPLYGEWSEGENIVMSQFIKPGDTVIDVGANIGTTAISLSRNVGNSGKVYAFEPQQVISQCLNTNLLINNIKNVEAYTMAISSLSGWVKLDSDELNAKGMYGLVGIADKGHRVKSITLNEFEVNNCSFIKIDVEGHEWEVIKGADSFLLKHSPVVYLEAKKELIGTNNCLDWFLTNGWNCYWHFAVWFRGNNWKSNKKNIFGDTGDMNIVAVPKSKSQPKNLLKINSKDEEWDGEKYMSFYSENGIPRI
jgi:FkbM family methyltransferase